MKSLLKFILILSFSFGSLIAFSQEFKTPLKVVKGQEYNYQTDMVMDITMTMGAQEMKMSSSSSAVSKNKIEALLADGGVEVSMAAYDAVVSSKMMMIDTVMRFDGKVSPTYKLQLNKYGRLVSKTKTDTTGINLPGAKAFPDNALVSSGLFCEFPEKNLKIGEKWNVEHSDSVDNAGMGGKLGFLVKTEYTLGAKEVLEGKDVQKINYTSTLDLEGKGKMQGMDFFIEGSGVQNGDMFIDPTTKVIVQNKMVMELDMTVAVSGQQSMTMPMTQKITLTQKLK